jgi:hypothetical protein
MKNFILLFSAAFSIANANIRVGTTGGGLGEMKAYSVVVQLPTIIEICSTTAQHCGMTTAQLDELQRLERAMDLSHLQLVAPFSGTTHFAGNTLDINSQDLYQNGIPKKFGDVAALCLATLLRDELHVSDSNWPFTVFSRFQEEMRDLALPNLHFTLHAISLSQPGSGDAILQSLALEKPQVSVDLTADLLQKLGCEKANWHIQDWNYVAAQSWVRADLSWSCQGQSWQGELQLLLSQEQVSMQIVHRVQIQ